MQGFGGAVEFPLHQFKTAAGSVQAGNGGQFPDLNVGGGASAEDLCKVNQSDSIHTIQYSNLVTQ